MIREGLEGRQGSAAVMRNVRAAHSARLLGSTARGEERENGELVANNLGKRWEKKQKTVQENVSSHLRNHWITQRQVGLRAGALTQDPRTQHPFCSSCACEKRPKPARFYTDKMERRREARLKEALRITADTARFSKFAQKKGPERKPKHLCSGAEGLWWQG